MHHHAPLRSWRESAYVEPRCVNPEACVPESHDGRLVKDWCRCGAVREMNINGQHVESTGWRRQDT